MQLQAAQKGFILHHTQKKRTGSNSDFAGTIPDLRQQYGSHLKTEVIPSCVIEAERQKPVTAPLLNSSFLPDSTTKFKDCTCKRRDLHLHIREWVSSRVDELCFPWHTSPIYLAAEKAIWSEFTPSLMPCQSAPASVSDQASTKVPTGSWFLFCTLGQGLTVINKE